MSISDTRNRFLTITPGNQVLKAFSQRQLGRKPQGFDFGDVCITIANVTIAKLVNYVWTEVFAAKLNEGFRQIQN